MDFGTVPETILTAKGRQQAEHPPDFVLGRVLTPGGLEGFQGATREADGAAPVSGERRNGA